MKKTYLSLILLIIMCRLSAQIFDNELKDSGIKLNNIQLPLVDKRSPTTKEIDYNLGKEEIFKTEKTSKKNGVHWGEMTNIDAQTGIQSNSEKKELLNTGQVQKNNNAKVGNMTNVVVQRGFERPFSSVNAATLLENKRYPMYQRGVDLENIYGIQQGFLLRVYRPFFDTVYLTKQERESPFLLFINLLVSAFATNFIIYLLIIGIVFLKNKFS